ncbi:MAG: hypothetical protein SFW62_07140 [Alphaproteobacteria bacterium]|nr:hypothetical protein [Alphaproteobacteria bacterium]
MPRSPSRPSWLPEKLLEFVVLVPVAAIILGALVIAGTAMLENVRFARATEQILGLTAIAHDFAKRDRNFATQPGEDLLKSLSNAGRVQGVIDGKPALLANPWRMPVKMSAMLASVMRLETTVPTRDCRRLAMFLVKNGVALDVRALEAHSNNTTWQRFYDRTKDVVDEKAIDAACGRSDEAVLAVVFFLPR